MSSVKSGVTSAKAAPGRAAATKSVIGAPASARGAVASKIAPKGLGSRSVLAPTTKPTLA